MARKNKIWPIVLAVLIVLLAALAVGSLWGWRYYKKTYITIDGTRYLRSVQTLDLSGAPLGDLTGVSELKKLEELDLRDTGLTAEGYEALHAALPGCRILWNPPFQGKFYEENTGEFTVTELSDSDIDALAYFPELNAVDATLCRDYEQVFALMERYPDCNVAYQVEIGGKVYPKETETLELAGSDAAKLMQVISYLPRLNQVRVTAPLPEGQVLRELVDGFPNVTFSWQVSLCGMEVDSDVTELDLSGIPMESVDEVEAALPYLPKLSWVDMSDCGISNEEMDALNRRHEDVRFIWALNIGEYIRVRTDETIFMPAKFNRTITNEDAKDLKYLTDLIVLDLGHHQNITDSEFLQYLTKMQFLLLADTGISDISGVASMKQLKYAELFMSPIDDLSPLLECTALQDLNLYYVEGDPEIVAQMTWLKRLWWGLSGMSISEMREYEKRFPDTEVNLWHTEATNGGWRQGELYYEMRDLLGMPYME